MSLDRRDDRAVSPVIATILMVAIVVILAAVAGAYVLDLGTHSADPAPAVRFDAVYDERTTGNGQYLNVTVSGGERAPTHRLWFVVDGATDGAGTDATLTSEPLDQVGSELITADTISIDATDFDTDPVDLSDATVTLVWDADPDAGEPSQTQAVWTWEAD